MGFLQIHTAHPVVTDRTTLITVRGIVSTENVNDLQYHIEAVYFLHGPCDVHVDLAEMTANVRDQDWIDRLAAAARTARLRRGRLTVCQPPVHTISAITAAGVTCCDQEHRGSAPHQGNLPPQARTHPHTRTG